jgi:anti-sigma-K factor RskA
MSDNHEILGLLPAHALGSLSPEEAARVEEHLPGCPECRQQLAAWREVTAALAFGVEQLTPPEGLETRLMARLEERRPSRKAPLIFRFQRPVLAAVASVLIAVLAAGNVALCVRQSQPHSSVTSSLITVFLTGTQDAHDAYGTVVIDRDDNHGIMAVRGLQPLDPSHAYQLWLVRSGERRSGGVFSVNADGYGSLQITVPSDFRGFTSFGISIEPATGSPAPTGPRVMKGTI